MAKGSFILIGQHNHIIFSISKNKTRLRFVERWEHEISKNPIFIEEYEEEERYLKNNDGPGKPCGRIYREFGLHGQYMELRDASFDRSYIENGNVNGIDDLGDTDFGNDHLMSMVPFKGEQKQLVLSVYSKFSGRSSPINSYRGSHIRVTGSYMSKPETKDQTLMCDPS